MYGELIPLGGGDSIPLLKRQLLIGRRESCDIVLRFSNVSAHHCQLYLNGGYWYVKDLGSSNGTRINNVHVTERLVSPGDTLRVAKHAYTMKYSPADLGAVGPPPMDQEVANGIFGQSLMEKAGLDRRKKPGEGPRKYDPTNDGPGQIKDKNKPV